MIEKIKESEIKEKSMSGLPTRPNSVGLYGEKKMTPQDLKDRMDALPLLAIEVLNGLIDKINEGSIAEDMPVLTTGEDEQVLTLSDVFTKMINGELAQYLKVSKNVSLSSFYTKFLELQTGVGSGEGNGIGNETNIPYAHISGINNKAVVKCFLIDKIEDIKDGANYLGKCKVTLKEVEGIEVGDDVTVFASDTQIPEGFKRYRGYIREIDKDNNEVVWEHFCLDEIKLTPSDRPTFMDTFFVKGGTIGIDLDVLECDKFSATMSGVNNLAFLNALASGMNTKALGYNSITGGYYTEALGERSIALIYRSIARAMESIAAGLNCETGVDAQGSFAGGNWSKTTDKYQFTWGDHLKARGRAQAVFGEYNEEDAEEKFIFSVGNGKSDAERSNAMAVTRNGVLYANGQEVAIKNSELLIYYNLFVQKGLVYHMNFTGAEPGPTTTYNEKDFTHVVKKVDKIKNPWWGDGSSVLGPGYFFEKVNTCIDFYFGGVKEILKSADAISVELTAKFGGDYNVWLCCGPILKIRPSGTDVHIFSPDPSSDKMGENSMISLNYDKIIMNGALKNTNVNTYAFVMDMTNIANSKYTLDAYGNGNNYKTQDIETTTTEFKGYGMLAPYNDGTLDVYAMRVYNRGLSEDEVLQNHFADIALINRLDVTKFSRATDDKKQKVYLAFKDVSASDTCLQLKLDKLLNDVSAAEQEWLDTHRAIYTGTEAPTNDVGNNGDIYFVYETE